MRKVAQEKLPFVREEVIAREARTALRRRSAQARAPRGLRRSDEVISTYTDGPFVDLCRGPHVPDTSRLKHFKLLHSGRRVLARRREAADAAAHLRHGLLQEGRARRAPAPHRGGEAPRPPRARQGARPVPASIRVRPAPRSGRSAARSLYNTLVDFVRERQQERLPSRSRRRCSTTRGCGSSRGTGASTREHVPRARQRDRRARHVAQADELPVALPATSLRRSTRTASCRCAT